MVNDSLRIGVTGLVAATSRVAAVAGNLANLRTTGRVPAMPSRQPATAAAAAPLPYEPVDAVQRTLVPGSVAASFQMRRPPLQPESDAASADEMVMAPERELASLSTAQAAYRASLRVVETADGMSRHLVDLLG